VNIVADGALDGQPVGALGTTVLAVRTTERRIETIPPRTYRLKAGETLFAVGAPNELRKQRRTERDETVLSTGQSLDRTPRRQSLGRRRRLYRVVLEAFADVSGEVVQVRGAPQGDDECTEGVEDEIHQGVSESVLGEDRPGAQRVGGEHDPELQDLPGDAVGQDEHEEEDEDELRREVGVLGVFVDRTDRRVPEGLYTRLCSK